MKNYLFPIVLSLAFVSIGLIHSCSKNSDTPKDPGIATSFTEEFRDVDTLTHANNAKWLSKNFWADNTGEFDYVEWQQGQVGTDKAGVHYGFPAYSSSGSEDEYAFSATCNCSSFSSWLITPVLSVKNGDKISFYTRASNGGYGHHMQVLANNSGSTNVGHSYNSVGDFTTILFDINPNQEQGTYPTTWTKYEYIFSGITDKMSTRIAFRHNMVNPMVSGSDVQGVGIDLFRFEVK